MVKADHKAPWIGMPTEMDPGSDRQYLGRQYTNAVEASGGIPLIIPLLDSRDNIKTIADRLDGIVLTGSHSDLDPALYEAERDGACGPIQPLRDQTDFVLLEAAFKRKIPVLAICFGIQSLNVFLGGTLIQDIPTFLPGSIQHESTKSKSNPLHEVELTCGSVLEQAAGKSRVFVNSTHHQAIERPGRGLEVLARAPDGVIEAVICSDMGHWIVGVQWHPEKSFSSDGFSQKIFEIFLARCRAARGEQ
jgi:putative glutamine amidotransferase